MDYLVHGKNEHQDIDWKDLFDVIIVGGGKPAFLSDAYIPIFKVTESGLLKNLDDNNLLSAEYIRKEGKVFQGGCWQDLHRMLEITTGDKLLYVGDHMYADIVRFV